MLTKPNKKIQHQKKHNENVVVFKTFFLSHFLMLEIYRTKK